MEHPISSRRLMTRCHFVRSILVCLSLAAPALARPIMMAQSDDGNENKQQAGFSIRKEDQKIIDALDDFARYSGKEAGEKAFASLATAADATPTGLIPSKDGFYIPTRIRIRQVLCSLSPAGRSAYRLFNDAKAKQD